MARVPQHNQAPYGQSWQLIFVDLMALMLAFFVLLFSMIVIPESKWQKVKDSLIETLNPDNARSPIVLAKREQTTVEDYRATGRNPQYIAALVADRLAGYPEMSNVVVEDDPQFVRVIIAADEVFTAGRATLTEQGEARLRALLEILRPIPNALSIHVYTSDLQFDRLSGFVDIWALGIEQSDVLARFLRDTGYGRGIDGVGARRPASFARGKAVGRRENSAYVSFRLAAERHKRQFFEIE